jgi:hypothetical protein
MMNPRLTPSLTGSAAVRQRRLQQLEGLVSASGDAASLGKNKSPLLEE